MTALEQYARLEAPGRYYDGQSAQPSHVILSFGERTLVILSFDEQVNDHWPLASLHGEMASDRETLQLMPYPGSDERVILSDPQMIMAIKKVCPGLLKRKADKRKVGKAFVWGGGAIGAVVAMIFVIVPALAEQMAFIIPPEREQQMGEAVAQQVLTLFSSGTEEEGFCTSDEGTAAVEKMRDRIAASIELPYPIQVDVIDHPLVNALAMPGGRIILMRGLIDEAESPEEVAGVLAHEIGHVIHRDPTVGVLRAAGTAGIFGLMLGDVFGASIVVAMTEAVVNASYQREAEERADETAYQLLTDAGLPTNDFAQFFARLAEVHGDVNGLFEYLSSHPNLKGRAERAIAADQLGSQTFEPVLSDRDWIAMREICN
ncbi:MAG: M48 family metallopeptidase [Pseudomonadota bacterium]